MAWTPNIQHLKRKELLDQKRFFRMLAEKNNYIDYDTTFAFYMALVELIGQELRENRYIRLPHLGDFALTEQKSRVALIGKIQAVIGSRAVLKFYVKEGLRRRFNQRQGSPRYTEVLPPPFIK